MAPSLLCHAVPPYWSSSPTRRLHGWLHAPPGPIAQQRPTRPHRALPRPRRRRPAPAFRRVAFRRRHPRARRAHRLRPRRDLRHLRRRHAADRGRARRVLSPQGGARALGAARRPRARPRQRPLLARGHAPHQPRRARGLRALPEPERGDDAPRDQERHARRPRRPGDGCVPCPSARHGRVGPFRMGLGPERPIRARRPPQHPPDARRPRRDEARARLAEAAARPTAASLSRGRRRARRGSASASRTPPARA